MALFAVKKAVRSVGEHIGVNLDNGHAARHQGQASKHPVREAALAIIASPIVEEFVYRRAVPEWVKRRFGATEQTRAARLIDTVSVLGFAASHIGNPATRAGRENLAIPISPLLGGAHYNYIAHTRGLGYSMGAHALHNALRVAEAAPKVRAGRSVK